MNNWITQELKSSADIKQALTINESFIAQASSAGQTIIETLKKGKKIMICGNGGSAADAQHFAAELTVRFETERKKLPAIALTTDTSAITACGNDYGFDDIFKLQVEALGNEGDLLIGITTSGNSPNIIKAYEEAQKKGMKTIILTGRDGGKLAKMPADAHVIVPHKETKRIQEVHITLIHAWCGAIDQAYTEVKNA